MKLSYLVLDGAEPAPACVLVHGQGGVPVEEMAAFARRAALEGPLVVPFGNYATTSSGMEVGGPCWYRSLPGGAGTDPLTLTRAVVQVSDLIADAGLDRPVLVGWRQGAAVALGAALFDRGAMAAVVAVDVPAAHLALLPAALSAEEGVPVCLATTGADEEAAAGLGVARDELARRGLPADVAERDNERAAADAAAGFLRAAVMQAGPSANEGSRS